MPIYTYFPVSCYLGPRQIARFDCTFCARGQKVQNEGWRLTAQIGILWNISSKSVGKYVRLYVRAHCACSFIIQLLLKNMRDLRV